MKRSFLSLSLLVSLGACVSPAREPGEPTAIMASKAEAEAPLSVKERQEMDLELAEMVRDLEEARLGLRLDTMQAESSKQDAEFEVLATKRAVDVARAGLARYREVEAPLLSEKAQLKVDEADSRLQSEEQDLQGILEIYEGEEEARAKTEIIRRNQKSVEFARKRLESERKEARLVTDFQVPAELRELEWSLEEAEQKQRAAERDLEKSELQGLQEMQAAQNRIAGLEAKLQRVRTRLGMAATAGAKQ